MRSICRRSGLFLLLSIASLSMACFPGKKMAVISAGSLLEEVAKASSRQSDLRLVQEGMPAYLMLMDGMIEAWPDNGPLLLAAAQGYSSYASAFWVDQDNDYAKLLYGKARRYALKSLELRGFKKPADMPLDDFQRTPQGAGKERRPLSLLDGRLLGKLDQPEHGIDGSPVGTAQGGGDDEEGPGGR